MRLRPLIVLAAVAVLVAGCSDDTTVTARDADALRTLVDADLSDDEESCLLDGLADLDVSIAAVIDGDLSAQEDTEVLALTLTCIEDLAADASFVEAFIAGAADEGVELSSGQARCAIAAAGEPEPSEAIAACLGSADAVGTGDYGDDEILDLLWDRCEAGNDQACDELYLTSPLSSAYEDFGRTCAGRLPDAIGGQCFEELG